VLEAAGARDPGAGSSSSAGFRDVSQSGRRSGPRWQWLGDAAREQPVCSPARYAIRLEVAAMLRFARRAVVAPARLLAHEPQGSCGKIMAALIAPSRLACCLDVHAVGAA
jgi:hypothetical protein